jgi:hypothetical protein
MDIETILVNNNHIPYLLCWLDGARDLIHISLRISLIIRK